VARIPTAAEEARFWSRIGSAWEGVAGRDLDAFLANLEALSADLPAEELTDLDRVMERKLYDLDRADVHAVIDGSSDKFLYRRGYIVALGRDYYEAANANPENAALDAEDDGSCEEMCYFFAHLRERRFGDWPDTGSGISRESGSNEAGWPDE
jgi:hypothetical protein